MTTENRADLTPENRTVHDARIIVAGDETACRPIIQKLDEWGFNRIEQANDTNEILEKAYRTRPALVICHRELAGNNPESFPPLVSENPNIKYTPLLLLGSNDIETKKLKEHRCGATASLPPENNDSDFYDTVSHLIRRFYRQELTLQLMDIDELTRIHNSKKIILLLKERLAIRNYRPLTIVLFDIAGLGTINRRYGYTAGDELLSSVGRIIAGGMRLYDHAGRIDGDTFLLIYPESDEKSARQAVMKLRELIAKTRITYNGTTLYPSASFGIVSLDCNSDYICRKLRVKTPEELFDTSLATGFDFTKYGANKERLFELLMTMARESLTEAKKRFCIHCEREIPGETGECPGCGGKELKSGGIALFSQLGI